MDKSKTSFLTFIINLGKCNKGFCFRGSSEVQGRHPSNLSSSGTLEIIVN